MASALDPSRPHFERTLLAWTHQSLQHHLYHNATFLAERLHAHAPSEDSAHVLSTCYFLAGERHRAYHVLQGCTSAQNRYLLALCCLELGHLNEAERMLLGQPAASSPPGGAPPAAEDVPNGASGCYLLGVICVKSQRRSQAARYFTQALELNPYLWSAYEGLCQLGLEPPPLAADGAGGAPPAPPLSGAMGFTPAAPAFGSAGLGLAAGALPATPASAMLGAGAFTPSPMPASGGGAEQQAGAAGLSPLPPLAGAGAGGAGFDNGLQPPQPGPYPPMGAATPDEGAAGAAAGGAPSRRRVTPGGVGSWLFNLGSGGGGAGGAGSSPAQPPSGAAGGAGAASPMVDDGVRIPPPRKSSRTGGAAAAGSTGAPVRRSSRLSGGGAGGAGTTPASAQPHASQAGSKAGGAAAADGAAAAAAAAAPTPSAGCAVAALLQHMARALAALSAYRAPRALELLQALPRQHYRTGWVLCHVGRAHFEMVNYAEAERAFSAALSIEPHRLAGHELHSTLLWHLRAEAKLCCLSQHALALNRMSAHTWAILGNCFSLQKEHDTALKFLKRAIQLSPDFAYAHTLCGHEYAANEDFEKALGAYRRAILLDDRHYNAWYGLGSIYFRQEKYDLAEFHLARALQINGGSSPLQCYLGMALHEKAVHENQRPERALAVLERAISLDPANPLARFQKARVLISLEEQQLALDELLALRELAPKEGAVHLMLGKIYKRMGQPQKALVCLSTALDLNPKDAQMIKTAIHKLDSTDDDVDEDEP